MPGGSRADGRRVAAAATVESCCYLYSDGLLTLPCGRRWSGLRTRVTAAKLIHTPAPLSPPQLPTVRHARGGAAFTSPPFHISTPPIGRGWTCPRTDGDHTPHTPPLRPKGRPTRWPTATPWPTGAPATTSPAAAAADDSRPSAPSLRAWRASTGRRGRPRWSSTARGGRWQWPSREPTPRHHR